MRVVAFSGLRRDRKAISFIGVALLFGGYAAGTLCNFEIQAGVGREFIAKKAGERLAFSVDDVGGLLLMQSAILTAASWLGSLPKLRPSYGVIAPGHMASTETEAPLFRDCCENKQRDNPTRYATGRREPQPCSNENMPSDALSAMRDPASTEALLRVTTAGWSVTCPPNEIERVSASSCPLRITSPRRRPVAETAIRARDDVFTSMNKWR
jgi:hypothetical protein